MAEQKRRYGSKSVRDAEAATGNGGNGSDAFGLEAEGGEFTGRYIVAFKEGAEREGMALLSRSAGI
ncbi:MAG TPA: hypothetical protein VIJ02_05870, partial [Thermoanaerobaculia bacterium]